MKPTKKQFLAILAARPHLECVRHPNPKGLGPRRFLKFEKKEYVFLRPNLKYQNEWDPKEVPSYLEGDADIVLTDNGFTILDGRIEYVFREDQ